MGSFWSSSSFSSPSPSSFPFPIGSQTAVIVIDLWDRHWDRGAQQRMTTFLPSTNTFLHRLREAGTIVIHCPADCMAFYQGHPARQRTLVAIKHEPTPIIHRPSLPPLPISEGTTHGCDDIPTCPLGQPWMRQNELIDIDSGRDYIGDGTDALRLLSHLKIKNVIVTGVHLNICMLDRDYGIRALVSQNLNVVAIVGSLTDVMYVPSASHGWDRITAIDEMAKFIGLHLCPTITAEAFKFDFI